MAPDERLRFDDDSEDEDDFNPAPADVSDEEDADQQEQRETRDESPAQHDDGEDEEPTSTRKAASDRQDSDDEDEPRQRKSNGAGAEEELEEQEDLADQQDEDDEEGEGDEEEEEDEEDEEDEDIQQGHRRKRRRDRRNVFLDIEAEVDDEDEDQDEEREGEEIEGFIDHSFPDDIAENKSLDDSKRHRELDRRREVEAGLDAEKQAEILRQRYGKSRAGRNRGDATVIPKRLLLPSVDDPKIWAVRAREGKEREVIYAITKRIEERLGTKNELLITSAFERAGAQSVMKGYIYVEAHRQPDVMTALDGILNVYPRSKMELVEIKDMPDLLRVTKTPTLEPGAWVRLKRPLKYSGDLGQVLNLTENGLEARVRYIPRLDYGVRDESAPGSTAFGKRKRQFGGGPRPPQRLFNEAEARKRQPRQLNKLPNGWNYMGDEFENGFLVKDIKIQQLTVTDVNPSLEEVTRFASGAEDGTENLDLKALAASMKDSNALVTYLPGDVIEVFDGEQKGVVGKATNVQGDIVTLQVTEGDLAGQTIDVPAKGLRKRFRVGDHVKVIGGSRYQDEVGMVVKISDDRVTLVADQSANEITVFSRDLREADDSGGQGSLGQYNLFDLVQLDNTTVGCIIKIDRETLVALDQNGDRRQLLPSQIANKFPPKKNAVAADRSGSEIRIDDVVREYGNQQRRGKILHIHHGYVFLHSHDYNQDSGVFVLRAANVNTVAAKGGRINAPSGPDLTTMNPAMKRLPNGADGQMGPPPAPKVFGRDKAIGQTVVIRKGVYKGLLGIVKDTTDVAARVELHTKSKIITVPKEQLTYKDKNTGARIDINSRGPRGPPGGGFGGGGRVPEWQGGSRTPVVSSSSERTPAWGSRTPAPSGGRTPAWKSDLSGGRTPAWQDGSRTVNPYDGSRTAYGSGARTPAWQSGGRTPAVDYGAGSRTPAYANDNWSGSKTPGYGGAAATPGASGGDSWGYTPGASGSSHAYDAPTPGVLGAPTPALNAPTPGGYAAPTPAVSAPTPGASWSGGWADSAPTPAGAPTPGASGYAGGGSYYGAPTPGAYGGAPETPAGSGPRYTDDDD